MGIQRHFGIDFGTTNSSVVEYVTYDGKTHRLQHGDDEGRPMPSMVAIDKETGEVFTGRDAWNKRSELAQTCECVQSVKTLLEIDGWSKFIAGRWWTAQDIASEVFKALRRNVAGSEDENAMEAATVAVPIGFSRAKREALRAAARDAGIEIESFVSEPTAAFFANYAKLKGDGAVVIFDWGGGTLDVSVLRNSGGRITELATAGMPVAGDEIDDRLARRIHAKIARDRGVSVSFDEMPASAKDMLLVRAERAKRALSEDDDTVVSLNKYGEIGAFRERVSYEWFEAIVAGIVDDAIKCLEDAIADSGETPETVDRVVMVGGSSNIGPLLDKLAEKFGDRLFFPEATVWSISRGAAQLSQNPGSYHSSQKVGILLADGSYFPLLEPGDSIMDWSKSVDFGLVDTSKEMRVVFSGSPDIDNDAQSRQVVSVPSYRFLEEKLNVSAFIDEDSVFRVKLKSSMRKASDSELWEYDRLKLYYSLEECGL